MDRLSDFNPVYTDESYEFCDAMWLAFAERMNVFDISTNSCYAHIRLINIRDINFPLLSDTDGPYQESWDLPTTNRIPPGRPETCAGHVNSGHTIRDLWQTDNVNTQITLDELHNTIRRLTH